MPYFVRSRYAHAARIFLDGVRNYPESPKAADNLLKLGMTVARLGQKDEACLTLSEVAARYPNADESVLRRVQVESQRAGCQ